MEERRYAEAGFDPGNARIAQLKRFVGEILTFPRHLSQHVGGFVLTEHRLDETVPIHNGAMKDRTFIEWDKDDIDALRTEEHTSELQSLMRNSYAVFCLQKKNNNKLISDTYI